MRSRRSAITLLVVMILVVGALSAAERDRTRTKTATAPTPVQAEAQAQTLKTGRQVAATLPADSPVRAKVGDSIVLRVRSETPDIAQMLQLGLSAPVGPKLPGIIQFVAAAPGTFPVTLEVAGTVGGLVQVR